jgi:hypothetical protein
MLKLTRLVILAHMVYVLPIDPRHINLPTLISLNFPAAVPISGLKQVLFPNIGIILMREVSPERRKLSSVPSTLMPSMEAALITMPAAALYSHIGKRLISSSTSNKCHCMLQA